MIKPDAIQHLLRDRNLAEVSRRTGVSYATLRSLSAGKVARVKYETVVALASYFDSTKIPPM